MNERTNERTEGKMENGELQITIHDQYSNRCDI